MKKVAVLTGGSCGIGYHLADLLAADSYLVYDLSRSGRSRDGIIHIYTDLTDTGSIKAAFAQILSENDRIDLLINNAGIGISGAVEFARPEDIKTQFDVNFFGLVNSVQYALPLLRLSKGRIVNVSSVAALLPVPFQTFYSASKAAVNVYSAALANEIRRFGISVTCVLPGDTNTGFTQARTKNHQGDTLYQGAIDRSVSLMEKDEQRGMESIFVARRIFKAATRKRARLQTIVGTRYKLFAFLSKILPVQLVNRLIGMIYAG